jgi:transposase-like protein
LTDQCCNNHFGQKQCCWCKREKSTHIVDERTTGATEERQETPDYSTLCQDKKELQTRNEGRCVQAVLLLRGLNCERHGRANQWWVEKKEEIWKSVILYSFQN